MKTTFTLLGLVTIVLLSSCGTSGVAVLKRKYNPGYCVDFGSKINGSHTNGVDSEKAEKISKNVSGIKDETAIENTNDVDFKDTTQLDYNYPLTASNEKGIYLAPNKTQNFNFAKTATSTVVEEKIETKKESKFAKRIAVRLKNKMNNSKSKAMDDQTILLVILSLFPILALIAIYIKDGQTITTNFWIDLLLHFIFLYWLFALLVVLDVINLA